MTISVVIFDLDETLIDREATMREFLMKQHRRLSGILNCDSTHYANTVLSFQNGGYADKRTAFQSALSELNQASDSLEIVFQDFKDSYGSEAIAFPTVHNTLEILGSSFTLGLISNGRSIGQRNKLRSANIESLFDAVVISEEVGLKKPDPKIFQHCLKLLGVTATEAVYVGDNPSNDIEPANKLGMISIWVENPNFHAPQEANATISNISNISDLPDTIGRLALK